MNSENESASNLEGTLLLASPSLVDPTFSKTVILLASHTAADGAYGYILNRPIGKTVKELLDDEELGLLGDIPIYIGGPVAMSQLSFASLQWMPKKKVFRLRTNLSHDQAFAQLQKGYLVRAFIGYSGWTEGQLEQEMNFQSWIKSEPVRLAIEVEGETLWSSMLSEMGPYFRMMSFMPSDLSMN